MTEALCDAGDVVLVEDPARPRPDHEMRLSYGSASEEEIRLGVRRLGRVLHELGAT